MSSVGSPLQTSLLQTLQAQTTAGKARDREKAATDRGQRYQDLLDLRVAGVEAAQALTALPHNDSEEAEQEQQRRDRCILGSKSSGADDEHPSIDVRA